MTDEPTKLALGVPTVDFDRLRRWARAADEAGFAFVTVGDNPGYMRDTYVALTLLAQETTRCWIGTGVTSPRHRDVLVTASAMSSVETLAPDRVFLGLARGRAHLGASVDTLRSYIVALRQLWAGGEAIVDGKPVRLEWGAKPVPIVVGASGPRALQLAGELADGVLVESGVSPDAIAYARKNLEIGARTAGRDVDSIHTWWYVKASISDDREEAVQTVLAPTAASGALVLGAQPEGRQVPERLWAKCRQLRDRYDFSAHVRVGSDNPNSRLLDDEDLRQYLFDRFVLSGTPGDWLSRIADLRSLGANHLYVVAVVPDPEALVRKAGESVIPALS